MLDINALLEEIKATPYVEFSINAPHAGVVNFAELKPGQEVHGPLGAWKEKPGTMLLKLERERNVKPIYATERCEVVSVNSELAGQFVEAGTELLQVRHFLSKEEVLQKILRGVLHLFVAPERAKYYFTPALDVKVKTSGPKSVTLHDGMELFIISRMKRETPLRYSGPSGVIYAVYFSLNQNVDAGHPLIGICPEGQLNQIEEVAVRVQTEWQER